MKIFKIILVIILTIIGYFLFRNILGGVGGFILGLVIALSIKDKKAEAKKKNQAPQIKTTTKVQNTTQEHNNKQKLEEINQKIDNYYSQKKKEQQINQKQQEKEQRKINENKKKEQESQKTKLIEKTIIKEEKKNEKQIPEIKKEEQPIIKSVSPEENKPSNIDEDAIIIENGDYISVDDNFIQNDFASDLLKLSDKFLEDISIKEIQNYSDILNLDYSKINRSDILTLNVEVSSYEEA